jgi:hypothetical protein
MLYPFFALYLTQKFDVGMTTAGGIFGSFSLRIRGQCARWRMTDRVGRKR